MEKMNYKIIIQYDGTRYDGWQKQGNTANTIQGRLEAMGRGARTRAYMPWGRRQIFISRRRRIRRNFRRI